MQESPVIARIKQHFGDDLIATHQHLGEDTVIIRREKIVELARFLKEDPELQFNFLMDLAAVDYLPRRPRFEVVYHFFSLRNRLRLRVKVPVPEHDAVVDSLCPLWKGADWYEREAWDMFGIRFRNHPDLRRILMYDEFEGHPLRKDYPYNKRQPLIGPRD
ncbi:MAG TPA: NADH-quinone oxidoreductase subunit C [Acidobacteriota bacterium]|nr:NADH-quinone oxidoreductase subunit C [Acidobacteriota bacterium]